MHSNRDGTLVNYNEAMLWYQKAVENGDYRAMHNIGTLYYQGLGVEQDYCRASQWFEKAAEKGSAIDQYNLGIMYATGSGVEQNSESAEYWLLKAATQNYSDERRTLDQIRSSNNNSVTQE